VIKVDIQKCSVPAFWLDTSIIIKMALWKSGRKLNDTDSKKISLLYAKLSELQKDYKLFCPLGDQQEEIWAGEEICHEIASKFSLGIHFKHRYSIKKTQIISFMKAFIEEKKRVKLIFRDAFFEDPITEIENLKYKNIVVSVLPFKIQNISDILNSQKKKRIYSK